MERGVIRGGEVRGLQRENERGLWRLGRGYDGVRVGRKEENERILGKSWSGWIVLDE